MMKYLVTFCLICVYANSLTAQNTLVGINLYDASRFDNGLSSSDGLIIDFQAGNNNGVDSFDAPKFLNPDESFARQNGTDLLSIERRDIPVDNERLLLFNSTYRTMDYVFEVDTFQFPELLSFYIDTYTGNIYPIGRGQVEEIRFSVDNSIAESIAANRFELSFIEKSDYNYSSTWINLDPCITAISASDNLNIESGIALIDCDIIVKNITVASGATLQIAAGRTVTVHGDIINLGNIDATEAVINLKNSGTFYSNNSQLGDLTLNDNQTMEFTGTFDIYGMVKHSGSGNATVENNNADITFKSSSSKQAYLLPANLDITSPIISEIYMSANRAFRFISSPVNTTSTIYENWQENGNESIIGFGTDITGIGGAANGFDVTSTNNPSMYGWDNIGQSWEEQASTNLTTDVISAGVPKRLFIRGDRQVDLTTNVDAMRETILRTKGSLPNVIHLPIMNQNDGAFNMIGNPYLAPYNLDGMLSNLNVDNNPVDAPGTRATFFYVFDPQLQSNGAYVAYDVDLNMSSNSSSTANGFLQPYQAAFVIANGIAGDFEFKDTYINSNPTHVQVMSNPLFMRIELIKDQLVKDGVLLKFDSVLSNLVDDNDALKIANQDENLSITQGAIHTSINARDLPIHNEVIELNITKLSSGIHEFQLSPVVFTGVQAYLKDNFTGQSILLDSTAMTNYRFDIDAANPQSVHPARFYIEFLNSTLNVEDSAFAKAISIYPNPSNDGYLNIEIPREVNLKSIMVFNTLGQNVKIMEVLNNNKKIDLADLKKGLYLLKLDINGETVTKKVILE